MSILIDNYINEDKELAHNESKGNFWYIAKPLNKISVKNKIKDALRILKGDSFAVHYFVDEK
jgi:hypothetical protein